MAGGREGSGWGGACPTWAFGGRAAIRPGPAGVHAHCGAVAIDHRRPHLDGGTWPRTPHVTFPGWWGNKGHEVVFRSDGCSAGSRGFHAHRVRWLRPSRDLGRSVTRVSVATRAGGKDLACLRERRSSGRRSTPTTHRPASRERGSPIQEASSGAKTTVSIGRWRTMPARPDGTTDPRDL